jgi:hypothetical protein
VVQTNNEFKALEDRQPPLRTGEQTGFQAVITSPWVMRWAAIPATYAAYREIRKHPTIAIARELACAPIEAAEWSVHADDDACPEWTRFVQDAFFPLRDGYLEHVLRYGNVDYGYQGFEQVYESRGGYLKPVELKPLLHDITEICIGSTGHFVGFRQVGTELGTANSLLVSFRAEGSYLYGVPLLENIRLRYNEWLRCNDGAARYDAKIAGSHVIVEYPVGVSRDDKGLDVDNSVLAQRVLNQLESAGGVAIPRDVAAYMEVLNTDNPGWKIWIADQGTAQQGSFVERLNYLDKLLCRGLLQPERSVLEGVHGTKAEAETHQDAGMVLADLTHRKVTRAFQEQVVDPAVELNFGPQARGKVRLESAPLVDSKLGLFAEVYKAFLANPQGFVEESGNIDLDALKDTLGIPKSKELDASPGNPGKSEDLSWPQPAGLPGMDASSPLAASTRRIYRQLGGEIITT